MVTKIRVGTRVVPTSHWQQLNEIVGLMMSVRPKSILDVGVGFGKFGVLAREYLELWDGRDRYNDWQIIVDGIEAFEGYKNPIYDHVYNTVFFGDALKVLPVINRSYDLILMIDVIEHFTKEDGLLLLNHCIKAAKHTIISTPLNPSPQKGAFNNQYETHKSVFTVDDLPKNKTVVKNAKSLISLIYQ